MANATKEARTATTTNVILERMSNNGWDVTVNGVSLKPTAKVVVSQKGQRGHTNPVRVKLFGKYTATAVLRWMGKNGWTKEDALTALAVHGAHTVKESSVVAGLYDGTKGTKYGKPAPVSSWEARQLRDARN